MVMLTTNRSKIQKFCQNMHIFQISVHRFEYLMSCVFFYQNYSETISTKIKLFWNFDENR